MEQHHHAHEHAEHKSEAAEKAQVHETAPAQKKMTVSLNPKVIVSIITALLIIAGIYYGKGLIVAASVDNQLIGRLEVIKELETRSGQAALKSMINQRLIDNEAKARGVSVSQDEVNAEIKTVEDGLVAQGMSLEAALAGESMTHADLEEQVIARKKVEKILGDRVTVADAEIDQYIKDNKMTLEKGKEAEQKEQLKQQVQNSKLSAEAPKLLEELTAKAKIKYFVNY